MKKRRRLLSITGMRLVACAVGLAIALGMVPAPAFAEAADGTGGALVAVGNDFEAQEAPDMPAFERVQELDGVKVAVKAEAGVFPEGARLSVERPTREQGEQADAAVDKARAKGEIIASSLTLDVKVLDAEGNELQPAEGTKVIVSFSLAEVANKNLDTHVYHVKEDKATGEVAAESLDVTTMVTPETGEETTAVVETDGFSWYTLEFTYGEMSVSFNSFTSIELADILAWVGLAGEPTAVDVSNPELLSASNEGGAWVLTPLLPFPTEEWVEVTIDGVEYKIFVTSYESEFISGYIDLDGEFTSQSANRLLSNYGPLTNRWYLVGSVDDYQETYIENLTIPDDAASVVNIILSDGAVLRTKSITIAEGKTLRIWAQKGEFSGGLGKLNVTNNGIQVPEGSTLEINGGIITVTGDSLKKGQAGIGGKSGQNAGDITINRGEVMAWGTGDAAGIGGGSQGIGGNITITGGEVTAIAGSRAAGIGGGFGGSGGTITISGGKVKAAGGDNAAGIGGGLGLGGGTINITGGEIEATGGSQGAGIGGGRNGSGGSITIEGETRGTGYSTVVKATGGADGAGIGGGDLGESGNIIISGAYVEANGVRRAAGIGGGGNAIADKITIQRSPQGSPAYVVAIGDFGAGIGTGSSALLSDTSVPVVGGTVDISNSCVTAISTLGGAGIGGGIFGHVDRISISGGQTAAQGGLTIAPKVMPWLYILQPGGAAGLWSAGDVAGDIAGQSISEGVLDGGVNGLSSSIIQAHEMLWEGLSGTFTGDKSMIFYTGAGIGGGYHAPGGTISISDDAVVQATAGVLPPSGYLQDEIRINDAAVLYSPPDRAYPSRAIGSGAGDASSPSVTLYDDARVTTAQVELDARLRKSAGGTERTYTATAGDKATSDANVPNPDMDNKTGVDLAAEGNFAVIKPVPIVNIVFDANDGAGTATKSMEARQGKEVTLDKNEFTRTNYSFVEWNTKPDGTGTSYADEDSFTAPEEDLTLYAQWTKDAPAFKSVSVTLGAQLGLNFFIDLPEDEGISYDGSYVAFSVKGKETGRVPYDVNGIKNEKGYYRFTADLNVAQMAEKVTAVFRYKENGEEQTLTDEYSIKEYIMAFESVRDQEPYARAAELVDAIADYGHYTQVYLADAKHWTYGVDYAAMDFFPSNTYSSEQISEAVNAIKNEYGLIDLSLTEDITSPTITLTLDSRTAFNLQFTPAAGYTGTVSAKVEGMKVRVRKNDNGRYQVSALDIAANQLGSELEFVITTASGDSTFKASALYYANIVLGNGDNNVDDETRNAMVSIYRYYKAADAYAKAQ